MSEEAVDAPRREEPDYVPDPRRWRILGVTLVVGFMSLLDVTIVNVALPTMTKGLETDTATVQWVVSGYALTFGMTLVAGGRLGDAYGRRTLMLGGLIGFIASSAMVGLAPNVELVIAARLLQGATAGLLTPQNSGLIQQMFRGGERGKAFGLFGMTVSLASATGPVLGGLIIAAVGPEQGWRWLFLINVPIGLVALLAVARMVPKRPRSSTPADARIDVVGSLLLGAAVFFLLFPVVRIESGSYAFLAMLLLVPVLLYAFVKWERRCLRTGHPPLLDLGLLRGIPGYTQGLLIGAAYFTGYTGLLLVMSIYLQDALAYTPLQTGLMMVPFALGSAVAAPLAGRVVGRAGRRLTVGGLLALIVGLVLIGTLVPGQDPIWPWLVGPLFLSGLGGGCVISPNITLTLHDVPPRMGGAAGAALQTGQRIGTAIGAALLVTVYQVVGTDDGSTAGLRAALVTSGLVLLIALALAVRSAINERRRSA